MDRLTSFLFSFFPREVGNPYRRIVRTPEEFKKFVELNNGINPVFVSIYGFDMRIDKIWIEIDASSIKKALEMAIRLVKKIQDENIDFIPTFSGMKGFHFYLLFKPWLAPNKEIMKFIVRRIQELVADGVNYVDRHGFGNIRALVRVPNTMNKTNYCTYLPYDFVDWSAKRIVEWAKERHNFELKDFDLKLKHDIRDFLNIETFDRFADDIPSFPKINNLPSSLRYLSNLIRPCIIPYLQQEREPNHLMRVNLVSELMWLDFTQEQIHNLIRGLNWLDYEEQITEYQIGNIFKNKIRPLSCKNLREFVKCFKCGWRYCWK